MKLIMTPINRGGVLVGTTIILIILLLVLILT